MNVCLILNGYLEEAVRISRLTPLDFYLWGWMKSEIEEIKVDARDESLARIFACCCPYRDT
jgi:hypothetical protein